MILVQIASLFAVLSLLAFGGGNGVLPDMQRAAVDQHHWMTAREFLDMFAISRAAPGPGSLIVVLIGQKAAGLAGAAVAFVAMFGPSCLVAHLLARVWHLAARSDWRPVVEQALAPHRGRPDLRQRPGADARDRARRPSLRRHHHHHAVVFIYQRASGRIAGRGRRGRAADGGLTPRHDTPRRILAPG